jgi:ferric iron reductase protein FhuF
MSAIGLQLLTELPVRGQMRPLPVRPEHPLGLPLATLTALSGKPRAGVGLTGRSLDAWTLATELADPASERLERSLRRMGVNVKTADRLVMMSLFFGSYVWQLASAAIGSYLISQRVPDLSPENVAVHIGDDGRVDEIRFLGGGFAALPTDSAADHHEAVVVPDLAALRETMVRQLTSGHLEELILTLQTRRGLGSRALWAEVEDRCVGAMLWLGHRLDSPLNIEQEALALSRTPPFVGTSGVTVTVANGTRLLALKRGFCCLSYRMDGRSACQTCPLRCRQPSI